MIRVEHFARLQDAEGYVNELAHCRADDLHFGFASLRQAATESVDDRVMLSGHDRW